MKRILTIFLAVMMLFSITGCDPESRATLAGYMGKMGQNVLGSDTSSADNVVKDTQVSVEDVVSITKPEVGGPAVIVDVTENVTLKSEKAADGNTITKVAIKGLDEEVEVEGEVEAVLPPMKAKDKTIKDIGDSLKNKDSKEQLIKDMKEPVKDEKVKQAAKGTATIMKSALKQVSEKINIENKEIPTAVKDSLKNVSESLEAISSNPETVTQADVVTLQLVNSFVETVAKNSYEINKGEVPPEVLTEANNLFTVSSALSEASKFNPNTLVSALVSGMGETQTKSRSLSRDVATDGSQVSKLPIDPEVQTYINVAYNAVQSVVSDNNFAETKNGLGFHKMSYENYANMVVGKVKLRFINKNDVDGTVDCVYDESNEYLLSREFKEFKTFAGLTQYAVATVFSEGDDYYKEIVDILSSGKYHGREYIQPMDTSKWAKNIRDFIIDFAAVNPWVANPTKEKVQVVIPANYSDLMNLDTEMFKDLAMCLIGGRDIFDSTMPVNAGYKQYFRTAIDTMNKMVVFTDLSSIEQLLNGKKPNYMLMDLDEHLYVDLLHGSK